MRMHGLSNSVYLLIMYLYFVLQYLLYIIIMIVAGVAAGLEYFKRNSYGALRDQSASVCEEPAEAHGTFELRFTTLRGPRQRHKLWSVGMDDCCNSMCSNCCMFNGVCGSSLSALKQLFIHSLAAAATHECSRLYF